MHGLGVADGYLEEEGRRCQALRLIQGLGFRVQGLGFRVWGSGFRVEGTYSFSLPVVSLQKQLGVWRV